MSGIYYEYIDNTKMRDVKVGIIGCGGIANGKHMPSLVKLPNVSIVAFCDIILEKAEKAKKDFGDDDALVCTDYKELLAINDIEIVHVLTPNSSHCEISVAALNAKKHVMCEKPMAISGIQARKMCDAAQKNDRLLTIGYNTRSMMGCQYIHNMVKNGELGDIYFCKCPSIRRRGVPGWGVFIDKEKQGGGPLIDIGTHAIDAMLYMIGNYEIDSVLGSTYIKLADKSSVSNKFGLYDPSDITTEDSAFAFVRFKNGATMIVESSWALNSVQKNRSMICGSKAGVEFTEDKVFVNGERNGALFNEEVDMNPRMRAMFKNEKLTWKEYEAKQWISAVVNGTEVLTKPEEAAVVTEIIEAIYESASTGKAVYF